MVILKNCEIGDAPSILAASYSSSGISSIPASRTTVLKPVCHQTSINIIQRSAIFGSSIKSGGLIPKIFDINTANTPTLGKYRSFQTSDTATIDVTTGVKYIAV
jgi:hypothetical protein